MSLQQEIRAAINRHSRENVSCTPDFLLAEYLVDCLVAFEKLHTARRAWYAGAEEIADNIIKDPAPSANERP